MQYDDACLRGNHDTIGDESHSLALLCRVNTRSDRIAATKTNHKSDMSLASRKPTTDMMRRTLLQRDCETETQHRVSEVFNGRSRPNSFLPVQTIKRV